MVHRAPKHPKSAKLFGLNRLTVLLVAAVVLLIALALLHTAPSGRSVEVSFTDDSPGGMEIVPASCASPPPTAKGGNNAGYEVNNSVSNGEIDTQGYNFCVTDSGGGDYFVPTNSATEVQDVYNAVNSAKLPGVSQTSNTGGQSGTPTATLTADGSSNITVSDAATINWAWSSTNGASAQSSYTFNSAACGEGVGPYAWVADTLSGTVTGYTSSCYANHSFTVTYVVTGGQGGETASASVTVNVN